MSGRSQCAIKHTILSIQSEVVRGHVGNSVARFALRRTGFDVWAIPTVILSNHPGHGHSQGDTIEPKSIVGLFEGLARNGWISEIDGVLSGYLGHPEQAAIIAGIVRRVKAANPKALYLCDPVFGDDDGAYAKPGVAEAMARELVPLADIVAPNRFELSSLTSQRIGSPSDAVRAARLLGVPEVLVTSVPNDGGLANVVVNRQGAWCAAVQRLDAVPHGTGDMLSALYLGARTAGDEPASALQYAVSRVQSLIVASVGRDELQLVPAQDILVTPGEQVSVTPLS